MGEFLELEPFSNQAADIFLRPVATFITSWVGITVVCFGIIVFAVWHWFGFKHRIAPLLISLKQACDQVTDIQNAEQLTAHFQDFDQSISDNKLLGAAWQQFRTTLIFPQQDSLQTVSKVQPLGIYFSRDALLGRNLNLRLYNAIPNLLTGAGILGTFIGLASGIYLASSNLASDDIAQAKQAMQELLNGASLAFLTSIVGLLCSILFSFREKNWVHQFDERLGCWISSLEHRLGSNTAEHIAHAQLQQSRQQTEVLEVFTNELAFQIAEAFDQKLQTHVSTSVSPLLEQLVEGIQGLRGDRQTSNEAVLQKLLEQFTERLDGAAGTEMQALSDTLSNLNDRLKEQTQQFTQAHELSQQAVEESMNNLAELFKQGATGFQAQVTASVASLSSNVDQLLEKLGAQQEAANTQIDQRITKISDAFQKPLEVLKETVGRFEVISTKTQSGVEQLEVISTSLQNATKSIEDLAKPINEAASRFERSGEQVGTFSAKMSEASGELSQSVEAVCESNEATSAAWSDYRQRFEGIDEALGHAFQQMTDGLQSYTEQVNSFTQELDRHTADIAGKLSGVAEDLSRQIEDFNETLSVLERLPQARTTASGQARR